jgi:hypothetical protein
MSAALAAVAQENDPASGETAVGKEPADVSEWIGKLEDPNPAIRLKAAEDLRGLDPDAAEAHASDALPALVILATDKERSIQERAAAVYALESIGSVATNGTDAAVKLLSVLGDTTDEPFIRDEAGRVLAKLAGPDTVGSLVKMWSESDRNGKDNALLILRALAERSPETTVPALIPFLDDPQPLIRLFVVEELGSIDLAALGADSTVTSALLEIAKGKDPVVREAALAAIGKQTGMDPVVAKGAISALIEIAINTDNERDVRGASVTALGNLAGTDPVVTKDAISALLIIATSNDYEEDLRGSAKSALQDLAKRSPEATVPAFIQFLSDSQPLIRLFVVDELGSIDLAAKSVVTAATSALLDVVTKAGTKRCGHDRSRGRRDRSWQSGKRISA